MRNLLKLNTKGKKAQFFVLSAFTIVAILYLISSWIQPYTIIDTSSVVLMQEPFVFNNIKEKAIETVRTSKSCDDLKYNLDEYTNFVNQFSASKNLYYNFNYSVSPCVNQPPSPVIVEGRLQLKSPNANLQSNFTMIWTPS
jgi:hypothetical protein